MKRIPVAYNQIHSKIDVLKFIDIFKSYLIIDLKKYYNLIEIDPKLINEKNNFFAKERSVDFDNINNNQIYQLFNYTDLHLIKLLHELETNKGLMSYYLSINRDQKNNFSSAIGEYKLLIEKNILLVEANEEILIKYTKEIIKLINEILSKIKLSNLNLLPTKFEIINFEKVKNMYPTLSKEDAINEIILNKECVLFIDLDNSFEQIKQKEILCFYKNASLYVKQKINNEIYEIFNLNLCPKLDDILEYYKYDQLINESSEVIKEIFNNYNDILGIEINFSKLLLFILNKMHICEILPTPIDDEIKKQLKKNKLFFF